MEYILVIMLKHYKIKFFCDLLLLLFDKRWFKIIIFIQKNKLYLIKYEFIF